MSARDRLQKLGQVQPAQLGVQGKPWRGTFEQDFGSTQRRSAEEGDGELWEHDAAPVKRVVAGNVDKTGLDRRRLDRNPVGLDPAAPLEFTVVVANLSFPVEVASFEIRNPQGACQQKNLTLGLKRGFGFRRRQPSQIQRAMTADAALGSALA